MKPNDAFRLGLPLGRIAIALIVIALVVDVVMRSAG